MIRETAKSRRKAARRILVVDTDPGGMRRVVELLQTRGFEVVTAASMEGCIRQVEICRPDLILLEMDDPALPGGRLRRTIRLAHPTIPLVMLAEEGHADAIGGDGADGCTIALSKPVSVERLCGAIDRCLRNREQIRLRISDWPARPFKRIPSIPVA